MDKWTRLHTAFDLRQPDRPPILGGWLAAPGHIQTLTGCTEDEYWADPEAWGIAAEKKLDSDGIIVVFTPVSRGEYRCVDQEVLDERAYYTVERVLEYIEVAPSAEELRDGFDEEAMYAAILAEHQEMQAQVRRYRVVSGGLVDDPQGAVVSRVRIRGCADDAGPASQNGIASWSVFRRSGDGSGLPCAHG